MPDSSPLVVVTGATGAVGPAVVREALSRGYRVRALVRTPPSAGLLPAAVECRLGDICDERTARSVLDGATHVLHLAALLHLTSAADRLRAPYAETNTTAVSRLVRLAAPAGIARFVFFSTIAVYGSGRDEVLTEQSEPLPDTEYGRSKLLAEAAVLEARRADGSPLGVVLRPAAVYGSRVRGNYRTMLVALAGRRPMPVRPGENRRTLVFDEDLAAAAVTALSHPSAPGRIFNVTDGTTHSLREVTDAMCRALGRKPPAIGVPAAPLLAMLRAVGPVAAAGPLRSVRTLLEKYSEQVMVEGTRIQRELGVSPRVMLDEGWQRTVDALHRAGAL
jgi:nucleoside-diphosphate-sugar epimerase